MCVEFLLQLNPLQQHVLLVPSPTFSLMPNRHTFLVHGPSSELFDGQQPLAIILTSPLFEIKAVVKQLL